MKRHFITGIVLLMSTTAVVGNDFALLPAPIGLVNGRNGARWSGELWALNTSATTMWVTAGPCRLDDNICSVELPPGKVVQIPPPAVVDSQLPYTTISTPARETGGPGLGSVQFTLRVRDLTRQGHSAGTEIPVVRPEKFYGSTLHLPDVPLFTRQRMTLRIFLRPDRTEPQSFTVRVTSDTGPIRGPFDERRVTLTPAVLPPDQVGLAAPFAVLANLYGGVNSDVSDKMPSFVRVEIVPDNPGEPHFWAYLTATNVDNHHVTTITPQ